MFVGVRLDQKERLVDIRYSLEVLPCEVIRITLDGKLSGIDRHLGANEYSFHIQVRDADPFQKDSSILHFNLHINLISNVCV